MKFAKYTTVPIEKSRTAIEQTLIRYGADQFMYGRDGSRIIIAFRMAGLNIRIEMTMPEKANEQRQAMRVLLLMLKAKLEWIESGMSTVDREFLADILLPDGTTVHKWLQPQLTSGHMPKALPMP